MIKMPSEKKPRVKKGHDEPLLRAELGPIKSIAKDRSVARSRFFRLLQPQILSKICIGGHADPISRDEQPTEKHRKGEPKEDNDGDADNKEEPPEEPVTFEDVPGAWNDAQSGGGKISRVTRQVAGLAITANPIALAAAI
jgi:hypothetical protein